MHKLYDILRLPFNRGRVIWTPDTGAGIIMANQYFMSHLAADLHRADGSRKHFDLGSGLVTNMGVMAMANDANWSASLNLATLGLAFNHATGTGTTAAASTDISLQTASTNGGQNPVAGTHVLVTAANLQKYQTVATVSYTGTEAVTEWVLLLDNFLSKTNGTPGVSISGTGPFTWTVTGTPYTASDATHRGEQQHIVIDTTASPNVYGLITSNAAGTLTVPAWYNTTNGNAGTTPTGTDALAIRPVIWDHKVFSAINVNSGDSITFTYSLTINSGG